SVDRRRRPGLGRVDEYLGELAVRKFADADDVRNPVVLKIEQFVKASIGKALAQAHVADLNVTMASSVSPVRSTLTPTQCRSSQTMPLATAASKMAFSRLSGSPFIEQGSTTPIAQGPSMRWPPAPILICQAAALAQRRAAFVLTRRPRTVAYMPLSDGGIGRAMVTGRF